MDQLDLSALTPALFIVYVIFIMLIGSAVSIAVMRLFQKKFVQVALYLVAAVVFLLLLLLVLNIWFL